MITYILSSFGYVISVMYRASKRPRRNIRQRGSITPRFGVRPDIAEVSRAKNGC